MTFRSLLVAALALGLSACADAPADETAISDDLAAVEVADAPAIPAGTYAIDQAHSRAEFRVRHLGISTVTGRFGTVAGTVTVGDGLGSLQANAVIDATSIDTGNEQRDGHLRSPDFFDVAQYPEITFDATAIRPGAGGQFTLVGDLTMHGVTRPIELDAEYLGTSSVQGIQKIGFTASGEITRQDWGLTWANTNEAGEALVGDEITLAIEVEADLQAADATPDA
ncbi:YceI family protein [Rubrivirga sp. IMCC45206]|uniref:YceI family protein n=1 Tax=Rubrivirga sp. IMCC45206 TaxID=3391614 RepID=UPI0039902D14